MKDARILLKEYFGYDTFRKSQEEVIENIINGKDVLAIMPTGGGKSICYQIPALMMEGLTIVISPLISLMKDQVDNIRETGIKAAYINSTISNLQIRDILLNASNGDYKIIYVAPERLQSTEFLIEVSKIKISQVAIDEAHCVSQWGHDFRTSYRYISKFINMLKERPVISSFTATATPEVKEDIIKLLDLRSPEVYISGFDRENLTLNVLKGVNKDRYLFSFLENNKTYSGIIYCSTRKEVDKIYSKLLDRGYSASRYHGGLSNEERAKNQEDFVYDRVNIVVATNAFGMGIDKSDIRFIIHYNMPQSIEGYYQEIGRAGRDGEKSECVLLFTPGDIQVQRFLIENSIENPERRQSSYRKLQSMIDYVYNNNCYRGYILKYFGDDSISHCGNCSNCNSEGEVIDRTIDAQKVMSCVFKMKRAFGTTMIIDVLRGSKNAKLLSFGFQSLSTYGIMKEFSKNDLKDFINTLIAHGFMDLKEGEFPVVALNPISMKILRSEEKVLFKSEEKAKIIFEVNKLYEELKELRFKLSSEYNLPPYMIFSDATLLEMSNRYPIEEEEFLDITGVGKLKYEKYGHIFSKSIMTYLEKEEIKSTFEYKNKENDKVKGNSEEILIESNLELLKLLLTKRDELAKKKRALPQVVISLNTLKEVSGRYPTSINELKDISGIGPKKIEEIGDEIINVVIDYLEDKKLEGDFIYKEKRKVIVDGERRKNPEIVLDKLSDGEEIKNISLELELSPSTIMGYLSNYIEEGNNVDFNVDYSEYFSEEFHGDIMKVIEKVGHEKVSEIKKKLPDHIPYDAIRASILKEIYKVG